MQGGNQRRNQIRDQIRDQIGNQGEPIENIDNNVLAMLASGLSLFLSEYIRKEAPEQDHTLNNGTSTVASFVMTIALLLAIKKSCCTTDPIQRRPAVNQRRPAVNQRGEAANVVGDSVGVVIGNRVDVGERIVPREGFVTGNSGGVGERSDPVEAVVIGNPVKEGVATGNTVAGVATTDASASVVVGKPTRSPATNPQGVSSGSACGSTDPNKGAKNLR